MKYLMIQTTDPITKKFNVNSLPVDDEEKDSKRIFNLWCDNRTPILKTVKILDKEYNVARINEYFMIEVDNDDLNEQDITNEIYEELLL
jgi:hypothetical protein